MTRQIAIILSTLLLTAACADAPTSPLSRPSAPLLSASPGARVVPGQYIVVLHDDVDDVPGLARRLAAAHGGRVNHTYQHAIKGFSVTMPAAAVQALLKNPQVAYVEHDQVALSMSTTQVIADTVRAWALDRIDQWDRPYSGSYTYSENGQGVTVYVIDSGIQTTHPEFGGRAVFGHDVCYMECNSMDGSGHGTRVAGVIGSNTYGVAKGVRLVSVRVMANNGPGRDTTGTASTIMAGVDWVTQDRARYPTVPAVANMSVGVAAHAALDAAVRRSIAAGVTYVAGAGNFGGDSLMWDACLLSPARIPEVITVAASTRFDGRLGSSSHGTCVDLFAPGLSVLTTNWNSGTILASGTSIAAPHVSGYAARYLQGYPLTTPAGVQSAIINLSTKNRLEPLALGAVNRLLYTNNPTGRGAGCCR